jgi:ABC-type branched-subunit amino acid transport system permease subunit
VEPAGGYAGQVLPGHAVAFYGIGAYTSTFAAASTSASTEWLGMLAGGGARPRCSAFGSAGVLAEKGTTAMAQ